MGVTKGMKLQVNFEARRVEELHGDLQAIAILLNRAKRVKDFATKRSLWNAYSRLSDRVHVSVLKDGQLRAEVIALAAKGTEAL
jgi:hypothetical protein